MLDPIISPVEITKSRWGPKVKRWGKNNSRRSDVTLSRSRASIFRHRTSYWMRAKISNQRETVDRTRLTAKISSVMKRATLRMTKSMIKCHQLRHIRQIKPMENREVVVCSRNFKISKIRRVRNTLPVIR